MENYQNYEEREKMMKKLTILLIIGLFMAIPIAAIKYLFFS